MCQCVYTLRYNITHIGHKYDYNNSYTETNRQTIMLAGTGSVTKHNSELAQSQQAVGCAADDKGG